MHGLTRTPVAQRYACDANTEQVLVSLVQCHYQGASETDYVTVLTQLYGDLLQH